MNGALRRRILATESACTNELTVAVSRVAEARLERMRGEETPLDPPVLILGDASPYMQVSIETATVISSLLTSLVSDRATEVPSSRSKSLIHHLRASLGRYVDGWWMQRWVWWRRRRRAC